MPGDPRLKAGCTVLPGDREIDRQLRQGLSHHPPCPLLKVRALRQEDPSTLSHGCGDRKSHRPVAGGGGAADDCAYVRVRVVRAEGQPVAGAGGEIAGETHGCFLPPRVVAGDCAERDAPVPGPVASHDITSAEDVALRELPVECEGEIPYTLP